MLALTIDEGFNPTDGSRVNAVQRMALEMMDRDLDDLTDTELMNRSTDDTWFIDLCLDKLHRLPSEIEPIMGCREYTSLQAFFIVKQAQQRMTQSFAKASQ